MEYIRFTQVIRIRKNTSGMLYRQVIYYHLTTLLTTWKYIYDTYAIISYEILIPSHDKKGGFAP